MKTTKTFYSNLDEKPLSIINNNDNEITIEIGNMDFQYDWSVLILDLKTAKSFVKSLNKQIKKQMQISTQEKIDAILSKYHQKLLKEAIESKNYEEITRIKNILK